MANLSVNKGISSDADSLFMKFARYCSIITVVLEIALGKAETFMKAILLIVDEPRKS